MVGKTPTATLCCSKRVVFLNLDRQNLIINDVKYGGHIRSYSQQYMDQLPCGPFTIGDLS